jgi:uncharacterized protein YaiL (DUF2058 family)
MADSLKDQLLALGFKQPAARKPEPQAPRERRADGRPPSGPGGNRDAANKPTGKGAPRPPRPAGGEPDLAQAYALRARVEREERVRAEREAAEQARLKRERKQKLAALLEGKSLNAADAETPRHFQHGGKIRRLYVTAEQLPALNRGELGIIQHLGRYLLVDRDTALAAQALAAEALVLLPDPNAPADDDIPPDLVW